MGLIVTHPPSPIAHPHPPHHTVSFPSPSPIPVTNPLHRIRTPERQYPMRQRQFIFLTLLILLILLTLSLATPPPHNTSFDKPASPPVSHDDHRMTAAEMFAEARAHSKKFLNGGFVQLIEWLFVIILVAPGTFPFLSCIVLSCATFWRRRVEAVSGGDNAAQQQWSVVNTPTDHRSVPVDQRISITRTRP